jgi:formate dehydrogenase subunit delta
MDIQRLITMANQIGDFYKSYPDQAQADLEVAGHLNRFWALPMRKQIAQYANEGGAGLHAHVLTAIKAHLQV